VKIQIVRRQAPVAAGIVLLRGLPVSARALPVSVLRLTASQLRGRGRGGHTLPGASLSPLQPAELVRGGDRLHRHVDAWRGRDRAVPVHHHRVTPASLLRSRGAIGQSKGGPER
jgi:hypothetical protein